jgi:serine/threonine protein kinase
MAIQIWQPGDKIKNDRFHILKQLGKGSFGITYLAEDTVKKQQIVIKTLNANQQGEADFAQKQENFVKEGFTLRTFNHPHIVKVYEPIQIGNLWGLVMEYIPGQNLDDYIKENWRLSETDALLYIDQIAQALDCVHQQKFFHRDVKPDNIMLRQDRNEVVLIDFGIAKEFVDQKTIYVSNTWGSEYYKPIEQFEKSGRFGAYTDIYSLAATLYHLLTGAPPGGGSPLYTSKARKDAQDKGWGDKLDEHLWGELATAGVSERTQSAIKAGMEIDPSQRPQTMTAFRELLELIKKQVIEIEDELDINQNWFEQGNDILESDICEKTLNSYDLALKIHPDNPTTWRCRGYTLDALGRYEEAISSYDRALKIKPDNFYTWYFRGSALDALGRHREAADSYDCALKIKECKRHDWCKRGNILTNLGKYNDAIDSYKHALKKQPHNYDALYGISTIFYEQHKYSKALKSCENALEINSDNPIIKDLHCKILEKLGSQKEILLENRVPDRENLLADEEDIDFETLDKDPLDEDPFDGLSELLGEEAIESNTLNLKGNVNHEENWVAPNNDLLNLDRYEKNINKYSQDPKHHLINVDLVTEHIQQPNLNSSQLADIGKTLDRHEENINKYSQDYKHHLININLVAERIEQPKLNSSQLAELRKIRHENAEQKKEKEKEEQSLILYRKYEKDIIDLVISLKLRPGNHQAWSRHASLMEKIGKYNEAIISYGRALNIQPSNHEAWCEFASLMEKMGKYNEAILSYNHALKIQPEDYETLRILGFLMDRVGKYEQALNIFNRALKLRPHHDDTRQRCVIMANKLHRQEEALRHSNHSK